MDFGVSQGSVLLSFLFLNYTNNLQETIKFSTTRQFAGDTNSVIKHNSVKQLKSTKTMMCENS